MGAVYTGQLEITRMAKARKHRQAAKDAELLANDKKGKKVEAVVSEEA